MSADSFARGYSMFVTYLAEPAVRSLAMGCLAAVALWAFRVKRVTTHLQAWTAVLCAALAMPVLGAFLPRVRVALPETPLMKSLQSSFERGQVRAVRQDAAATETAVKSVATTMHTSTRSKPLIDYAAPHTAKFAVVGGGLDKPQSTAPSKTFDQALNKGLAKPLGKEFAGDANGAPLDLLATAAVAQIPDPSIQNSSAATSGASAALRGFAIPWTAAVLGIYLLGVVILLVRLLVGILFSRRFEHAAKSIVDREALRLLRFRSCIAGLAKTPGLKESAMLAVPATVGVRRAVILLPADWRMWTEEQLDTILAHEISHVARRDALTQMLSLVHRAIFWFSPLSWWLDKQLTDLAEQASDEAALAGGADRTRYAETLVEFFKQLGAARGRVWWQGVSMAKATKPSSAEERVRRILAWKGAMSMKKSFALAVIALAVPVVFLAASVHPFVAQAQDKPPVPPQNVIMPGGPVAPELPSAPKGGIKGGVSTPALPPTPQGGVVAPAMIGTPPAATPSLPNAPTGGVVASPNIGPTPIAPSAVSGPRIVRPSQAPTTPPTAPAALSISSTGSVAQFASETSLASSEVQMPVAAQQETSVTITNGSYTSGGGPRYVMMLDSSDCAETSCNVSMSGSDEDLEHARKLRKNIKGPFIWFERDEKSYVITDASFIAKAKALFAPEDALGKQEDELGRQEDALGKQEDALGEQEDSVKVKIPDLSADIDHVRAELEQLRKESGATQSELGRLQSELGALQSQVGRYQSRAGVQQSGIGRQQGELGRQQAELGRKQAELGRQQAEISRNAMRQLRGMFDDAISKGVAKPE